MLLRLSSFISFGKFVYIMAREKLYVFSFCFSLCGGTPGNTQGLVPALSSEIIPYRLREYKGCWGSDLGWPYARQMASRCPIAPLLQNCTLLSALQRSMMNTVLQFLKHWHIKNVVLNRNLLHKEGHIKIS